jgi:tetraacyldisaccharide 4'-kinase
MTVLRPLRILLWPASLFYGLISGTRASLYSTGWLKRKRLQGAVISVGNLTVGGTGKTPFVMWLAEKLLQQGKRVVILSRGYRGSDGTSDEVELMRSRLENRVAFGVGKDRYAEGRRIESQQPLDVFILDDGFQHLQLARDLDILLIDASRPLERQLLLPAGPMREPVSAMKRAGMIVFTRTEKASGAEKAIRALSNLPVFAACTRVRGFRQAGVSSDSTLLLSAAELGAGPFFVFCGIGNPEAFIGDLQRSGIALAGRRFFADHHRYTLGDVRAIEQAAKIVGANALLTTEKDSWNLREVKFSRLPVFSSIIELEIAEEAALVSAVSQVIEARGAIV